MKKRSEGGEGTQNYAPTGKKAHSVFLYLLILFAIALGLILFSFVLHQRNVETADRYRQEELLQRIADMEDQHGASERRIAELEQEVGAFSKRTEALELLTAMVYLYHEGKTEECAALLSALQKDDLYLSLPTGGKQGADAPRNIYDALAAELTQNPPPAENG